MLRPAAQIMGQGIIVIEDVDHGAVASRSSWSST